MNRSFAQVVRRLSLASLNAAIQNKPHLIIDRLAALQPLLFEETVVKKELQKTVMMGPFAVIEDKGLENRKTAYETMYTMVSQYAGVIFAMLIGSSTPVSRKSTLGLSPTASLPL